MNKERILEIISGYCSAAGYSFNAGADQAWTDAVLGGVALAIEEDRDNRPILIGGHPFDVKDVLVKDKLLRAITEERVAILDIIRSAQGKLSDGNPARTVLQVLDGVIANRQHGDEALAQELA